MLHPVRSLAPDSLEREFEEARARGHEGLMLKSRSSPYRAGIRGRAWLKVKKSYGTLDVVVTAAELGHGKRAGKLSDYTFAVWRGDELVDVGKAYSGLTDLEIDQMTSRIATLCGFSFDAEALAARGGRLRVPPAIVLEVGFDGMQPSKRHKSGFALRFPRILRIRDDKQPREADTIEMVESLYRAQIASGHREEVVPKKKKQLSLFDDD
jgi:DNA ligase-1